MNTPNDDKELSQNDLRAEVSESTQVTDESLDEPLEASGADSLMEVSYRPELPDWGVYLSWPTDGQSWIHAADLSLAVRLIPSRRVFHRTRWDRTFYQLHYGDWSIRVRPTMWIRVDAVDLQVGQQVELLSREGANDPGIFTIRDVLYCPRKRVVEFALSQRGMTLPRMYAREDLRPLRVMHKLRSGFFQHAPQRSSLPPDLELLNVGNLTSE